MLESWRWLIFEWWIWLNGGGLFEFILFIVIDDGGSLPSLPFTVEWQKVSNFSHTSATWKGVGKFSKLWENWDFFFRWEWRRNKVKFFLMTCDLDGNFKGTLWGLSSLSMVIGGDFNLDRRSGYSVKAFNVGFEQFTFNYISTDFF